MARTPGSPTPGEDRYRVTLRLLPGLVRFKVADAHWTEPCNWGRAEPDTAIRLGEPFELTWQAFSHSIRQFSQDILLDLSSEPAAQAYVLEVKAPDPAHPFVTVSRSTSSQLPQQDRRDVQHDGERELTRLR